MKHVIFENSGEIDALMITTFGVNVKEGDDAIGFFGTGLKYSIAILARLGIPIQIQSGSTVHTFSKKQVTLRGKDFEFVAMNDTTLGFTTEVGKKWELWMAYRELFCNTKDEGGRVYESDDIPEPEGGITRVIVSGADFMNVRNQHAIYFLTSTPFIVSGDLEVHRGTCCHVFYKGVAVGPVSEKHGLHTYNMKQGVTLTEDRTMKSPHSVKSEIATAITKSRDREFIRNIILCHENFFESELDLDQYTRPSDEFMSVCEELMRTNVTGMNRTARDAYNRHSDKKVDPTPHEMDAVERKQLHRAMTFCKKSGFEIDKYPMQIVEKLGDHTYALAHNGSIYVAKNCFTKGTKFLASTLIEEFLHLDLGYSDCTREMQNHLFDLIVTFGERVIGEPV